MDYTQFLVHNKNNCVCNIVLSESYDIFLEKNDTEFELVIKNEEDEQNTQIISRLHNFIEEEKQKQLIDVLLVDKDCLITANLDLKDKLEKSEGLLSFYESKMVTKEAE